MFSKLETDRGLSSPAGQPHSHAMGSAERHVYDDILINRRKEQLSLCICVCISLPLYIYIYMPFFLSATLRPILQPLSLAASWEASERELLSSRTLWRAHLDLLSNMDELESCVTPLRLAEEGERLGLLTEQQRRRARD